MKKWILIYLKGLAMGASDVIPGVSGGTIAFITGIYERLINAIKSFNLQAIKLFFTGKFRRFWQHIDGTFLVCLIAGIGTSFFSFAKLLTYLLEHQPILVWSFFFGLIIASTVYIGKTVKWNVKTVIAFLIFTVLSFFITSPENQPLSGQGELWYIFLCGAIAICAMILPGISGSFILVLLGSYVYMLKALISFDIVVILVFLLGAGIGIIAFSNVLSWLFKHFKMITLASLTGFMFGSLNKIWPWKEVLTTYTDDDGKLVPLTERNLSPFSFEQITGNSPQIAKAVTLIIIGFVIIFAIEYVAERIQNKEKAVEE